MKTRILTLAACALCVAANLAFGEDAVSTNKPPKWDLSVAAGVTYTSGNSSTLLATANALAVRKWDEAKNEIDLGADGAYGKNDGVVNNNQAHGFIQYNRLFTERFYAYLRVDGLYDPIAGIDYRVTVSPGAGYYFIKGTNTMLRGEVGPGYLWEKNTNNTFDHYATLRFAERFEQKISAVAKFYEGVEFLPQVDDWSNYIINSTVGIETQMTKKTSLLAYLQDTYHSVPVGNLLKNDAKIVAAVKYTF